MPRDLSPAQLRTLLVEFYSRVDPGRLEAGLDVNGMIAWVMHNGIEQLDQRLKAKYGASLDFEVLNRRDDRRVSAMSRMSSVSTRFAEEYERLRAILKQALVVFYTKHQPSKLHDLDHILDWIEGNGVDKFNEKLMQKYGECLPSQGPSMSMMGASGSPANSQTKPTGAALSAAAQNELKIKILGLLNRFYAIHEPDQAIDQDNDPIATWGAQVGMEKLNAKLLQLYGASLETLEEDEAKMKQYGTLAPERPHSLPAGGDVESYVAVPSSSVPKALLKDV